MKRVEETRVCSLNFYRARLTIEKNVVEVRPVAGQGARTLEFPDFAFSRDG